MPVKITDYRTKFVETLTPIYDKLEAESFFYLILEDLRGLKRIDLALNPDNEITEIEKWGHLLEALKNEVPVQYLLGKTTFYGLTFEVNENVLIPRQETEELVDWIVSDHKDQNTKILDIGTGSGCIAISLAKSFTDAKVSAIDVSEKALAIAEKNAEINQVEVNFLSKNILTTDDLEERYDIIVSNPPYVRELEKDEIRKNVLAYEPHLALFVADDDALVFYRKIATLALKSLHPEGKLYFEINQYLGKEMLQLLESMGFKDIQLRKDIYGNDRMVKATI
ncbi:peptide chain release factor N(5)-glutamine methyltransferase [Flavobacterium pallidum]|uniref:Release factor glutamine methyltransferase n=1 Tax=Flavobacterium pallidum TaxID=2172098 RepID=A0A2S1SL76_9FLAO|nr:peptide chain release factor N(5)-glutamine methyltransferase [Flavobacterium pallidum]AWI27112.1 peptide chain release factor N(5)-glutamine methyltransferase [Flavobacterium pallidum]